MSRQGNSQLFPQRGPNTYLRGSTQKGDGAQTAGDSPPGNCSSACRNSQSNEHARTVLDRCHRHKKHTILSPCKVHRQDHDCIGTQAGHSDLQWADGCAF